MENQNTEFNNAVSEEVVAPQSTEDAAQTADVASGTSKGTQDRDTNAAYASMRRKLEAEYGGNNQRISNLDSAAKKAGFNTAEDYVDSLIAEHEGLTIDELRANRAAEAREDENRVLNSVQYKAKEQEIESLRSTILQKQMADDLAAIQGEYPDVKKLEDLGENFPKLISAGISPIEAARMIRGVQPTAPKATGTVGGGNPLKDYYTPEEVDALSDKDLSDPKIWDAVRKSMTKW